MFYIDIHYAPAKLALCGSHVWWNTTPKEFWVVALVCFSQMLRNKQATIEPLRKYTSIHSAVSKIKTPLFTCFFGVCLHIGSMSNKQKVCHLFKNSKTLSMQWVHRGNMRHFDGIQILHFTTINVLPWLVGTQNRTSSIIKQVFPSCATFLIKVFL